MYLCSAPRLQEIVPSYLQTEQHRQGLGLSGAEKREGIKHTDWCIYTVSSLSQADRSVCNCVCNCVCARGHQVKLVSIDAADVADGHSSIILGLIWNIILFFQVLICLLFLDIFSVHCVTSWRLAL